MVCWVRRMNDIQRIIGPVRGFVVLMVVALCLSACGSTNEALPQIRGRNPVATTEAWFRSINSGDMPLALAHFAPASRSQMHWSDFGSVKFDDVRCYLRGSGTTSADVRCSFMVPSPPPDLEGQDLWDVYMQRAKSGAWLITSYGQG
jgi:hypothetical protein